MKKETIEMLKKFVKLKIIFQIPIRKLYVTVISIILFDFLGYVLFIREIFCNLNRILNLLA